MKTDRRLTGFLLLQNSMLNAFVRQGLADRSLGCRAHLRPDGLLVANLCDNFTAFAVLQRRIAASFDGRAIGVPAERRGNRIVFASADPAFPPSPESLWRTARQEMSQDVVDYAAKARRMEPALHRWRKRAEARSPHVRS